MFALVAGACTVTLRAMPSLPAEVRSRTPLYTPPTPESAIMGSPNTQNGLAMGTYTNLC